MKTDNSDKFDETYNRLNNIISTAIAKALTENGGHNSIYINDKTAKKTFIINLRKCECYEGD